VYGLIRLLRGTPLLLPLLLLLGACGDEGNQMYRGRPSDGGLDYPEGGMNNNNTGPDMLIPPDLMMNSEGAKITILTPAKDALLKPTKVQVSASVEKGAGTEIMSVTTQVVGQQGSTKMTLRAGSLTVYEGELDMSTLRSGPVSIIVSAVNVRGISNSVSVNATYDAGPVITVREPTNTSYRGSASVVVEARSDTVLKTGGELKAIQATVQGINVPISIDKPDPYVWTGTGTIGFHVPEFITPLSGIQVVRVSATDKNDVTTTVERQFTVDEVGPSIEFGEPKIGQIVGGVVQLLVKVTDASGVDDTSVLAVWLNDAAKYSVAMARVPGTDNFSARFDATRLPEPRGLIYPTLSYRAKDRLGNQSFLGGSLILDNTPPVMSLQPPLTQVRSKDTEVGMRCSDPFSPIGEEPTLIKDGAVLGQIVAVRARITDRGNVAPGLAFEHLSGLDLTSIDMLATPMNLGGGMSPPIVVDADGKGICNNLNPLLQPVSAMTASNQALVLRMVPITVGGAPNYGSDPLPPFVGACVKPKTLARTAMPLCSIVELREPAFTYVIPGEVFTLPPTDGKSCVGLQLDSLNVLPEGPYCVALRGSDTVGNRNVARPLRVCINRTGGTACNAFNTAKANGTLPTCLGRYTPATQMVTTGAGQECALDPTTPYPLPREPYLL
jgi:hypothetical protein